MTEYLPTKEEGITITNLQKFMIMINGTEAQQQEAEAWFNRYFELDAYGRLEQKFPLTTKNVFQQAPLVMPKVECTEVIVMMQRRLNKEYMPSATGDVQYNSKPHYVLSADDMFKHWAEANFWSNPSCSGVYAHKEESARREVGEMYGVVKLNELTIVVGLKSLRVGVWVNGWFREWPASPEYKLSIDRNRLQEEIDIYF